MISYFETIPCPTDPYTQTYFGEHYGFFDIETTGFSQTKNQIYMIGGMYRNKDDIHLFQYFAENQEEEILILKEFQKIRKEISVFITFNGVGFDIPFLQFKENFYQLDNFWDKHQIIDLYKEVCQFSKLLSLPNKKQKTLEQFLGIERNDLYSGGDLIAVYKQYLKKPDSKAMKLLFLHNYEDVLGMLQLLPILSYKQLYQNKYTISSCELDELEDKKELRFVLDVTLSFPTSILYQKDDISLYCRDGHILITIPCVYAELKYFYDNYKDYFYLPDEDTAIHKSVGIYVDRAHRKKATASTCYTKKTDWFIPNFLPSSNEPAVFYSDRKSKKGFLSWNQGFLTDSDFQVPYLKGLLTDMLHTKTT